jgi:hypothetical protein
VRLFLLRQDNKRAAGDKKKDHNDQKVQIQALLHDLYSGGRWHLLRLQIDTSSPTPYTQRIILNHLHPNA